MDFSFIDITKIHVFIAVFLAVCLVVFLSIFVDLWDGVYTARKTGERIHSHKLRVTIAKMSEYWRFLVIGFLVDCLGFFFGFYFMPFAVVAFGVGLLIVEARSMFEHARRRKSHTAELPNLLAEIINASTKKDAQQVVEQLKQILNKDENNPG